MRLVSSPVRSAEAEAEAEAAAGTWRRMRVWACAHAVDDFYQGLVPASVPYFVLDRHLGYVAASGLASAAAVGSALPQIGFGLVVDRWRLTWLAPLGIALAGAGAGLAGLAPAYGVVLALLLVSGLGVAMFHPAAGRAARDEAGGSAAAMSWFAAGGAVGFLAAPVVATPALGALGVGATALFVPPALVMAGVLVRHVRRPVLRPAIAAPIGADRPGMFAVLTGVEVVRSTVSVATQTFVALYWIRALGAGAALGGLALGVELAGGVAGTLLGGRIADRVGMVRTVLLGNLLLVPSLVGLVLCRDPVLALPVVLTVGLVTSVPFGVLVKLGQDYLPSRPGTASGVTLGLAVSAGGLFLPLFGALAAGHGVRTVFVVLAVLPLAALAGATLLREPAPAAAGVRTC